MSEHTRGPWIAECVGVSSAGPDGVDVFEIQTADGYRRLAEHVGEADAKLISAAPDLLSALVSLEQAYSNSHSPQHRAACLSEAQAAIAKARGQS